MPSSLFFSLYRYKYTFHIHIHVYRDVLRSIPIALSQSVLNTVPHSRLRTGPCSNTGLRGGTITAAADVNKKQKGKLVMYVVLEFLYALSNQDLC